MNIKPLAAQGIANPSAVQTIKPQVEKEDSSADKPGVVVSISTQGKKALSNELNASKKENPTIISKATREEKTDKKEKVEKEEKKEKL